jgi:hypothetical protein
MMFDWLNILTFMMGLALFLLGIHYLRLIRKTPEGEMVSLFEDNVNVSRRVAYSIVFYGCFVGGTLMVAAVILQLA